MLFKWTQGFERLENDENRKKTYLTCIVRGKDNFDCQESNPVTEKCILWVTLTLQNGVSIFHNKEKLL